MARHTIELSTSTADKILGVLECIRRARDKAEVGDLNLRQKAQSGALAIRAAKRDAPARKRPAVEPSPRIPPKRNGERLWRTKDLVDLLGWVAQTAPRLAFDAETVIRRANADAAPLTGSGSSGERVAGGRHDPDGSVPGPVPNLAIRSASGVDDPVVQGLHRYLAQAVQLRDLVVAMLEAGAELNGLSLDDARKLVTEAAPGGECANLHCRRVVAGDATDRLRAGRCEACYRYRRRTGEERPAELCKQDFDEGGNLIAVAS